LVPSGQQITWGAWSALDVATGKILWQTADPTPGAIDRGSVSVANGVMYAGSNAGQMYALEASTGNILWSFESGGTVLDGPSIVDGTLFWGSGYREIQGTGNNKVFAFSLSWLGAWTGALDRSRQARLMLALNASLASTMVHVIRSPADIA
jgi:polyvinyl alcohol dehydrogenase (cytochrome)